jgi:bacterioferritin (cytochrome b1)
MRRLLVAFTALLVGAAWAQTAPRPVDLKPYLQAEVNEIAILTAQSERLRARGDTMGAAMLQSYIPDHEQQAARLRAAMRAMGGNPDTVRATGTAPLGTRLAMVRADENTHARVVQQYRALMNACGTNATVHNLAVLGLNGAMRHYNSLVVVRASSANTVAGRREALAAALALERGAVADLQAQSARLTALGNTTDAATLQALIPAHQQQATRLENQLAEAGGAPTQVMVPPTAPLNAREAILAAAHTQSLQMVSTYSVALGYLPSGPMNRVFAQGRTIASQAIARLENRPIPSA